MPRKQFKSVPLRVVNAKPGPRARKRAAGGTSRRFAVMLVALPLAAFSAVFFWDGGPASEALDMPEARPIVADQLSAHFERCSGPVRVNCVVDGDTFWFQGEKIRVADINAPEVSEPRCPEEAALGARATNRFLYLLNSGPFTLAPNNDGTGRDRDDYDRALLVVTRGGRSLGDTLVAEGLAEEWQGYRRDWC